MFLMLGLSPDNHGRATRLWGAQHLFPPGYLELKIFTQKDIIAVQLNTNHFHQSCYATMMFRPLQFHKCDTSIICVSKTVLCEFIQSCQLDSKYNRKPSIS